MKAYLGLEDGTLLEGRSVGAEGEAIGEIVFTTSMCGYQEILTDLSFAGQLILMTYPLIGNYGVNQWDIEADAPVAKGFVASDICGTPNNFRSETDLESYLKKHNIIGIDGIDTRKLTKILRTNGTMNAIITTQQDFDLKSRLDDLRSYHLKKPVPLVSCKEKQVYSPTGADNGLHIVLIDYGTKKNIIRSLTKRGCTVTAVPYNTSAQEIFALNPDGIMLSNGPGNPKDNEDIFPILRELYNSGIPIFAICLGHQLMTLALGGDTEKMKFGHRGGNHPVKDIDKDKVYITSQNHGYSVIADSLKNGRVTHINMNDNTVEGIQYTDKPVKTVQFHPEANPGPEDTAYLFDEFLETVKKYKEAK